MSDDVRRQYVSVRRTDLIQGPRGITGLQGVKGDRGPSSAWQTVDDHDLTSVPDYDFVVDADTISDQDVPFFAINVGALGTAGFHDGLVVTPFSDSDYLPYVDGYPFTFVGVGARFWELYPDFRLDMPVRVWMRSASFQPLGGDDGYALLIFDAEAARGDVNVSYLSVLYGAQVLVNPDPTLGAVVAAGGHGTGYAVTRAAPGDVLVLELPNGVIGGTATLYGGTFDVDWPDETDLIPLGTFTISNFTSSSSSKSWAFGLVAGHRDGGGGGGPQP